jgi:predicted Rossmann fold nucleotide-binding protein DprA/Smf involved in DNA uptake
LSDVIADLRNQMRQRLKDIERELAGFEELVRERDQIAAALAQPPFAEPRAAAPARRPAARKSTVRKSTRPRAPRGANREAVLTAVGERPGVTAATIADVTKISRAVTYNTLAKLVEQGKIEKTELPGGQTGYKAPAPA